MITLTRARRDDRLWHPPLTWDYWLWGIAPYTKTATVCCGNGHVGTVAPHVHAIAPDGTLSPSWVCPFKPCDWHEFARLDGWLEVEIEGGEK